MTTQQAPLKLSRGTRLLIRTFVHASDMLAEAEKVCTAAGLVYTALSDQLEDRGLTVRPEGDRVAVCLWRKNRDYWHFIPIVELADS